MGEGRMKATRKDHLIIKCARRLINNLDSHRSYTCNDEFAKDVQLELKRMRNHCEQARKEEEEWKS